MVLQLIRLCVVHIGTKHARTSTDANKPYANTCKRRQPINKKSPPARNAIEMPLAVRPKARPLLCPAGRVGRLAAGRHGRPVLQSGRQSVRRSALRRRERIRGRHRTAAAGSRPDRSQRYRTAAAVLRHGRPAVRRARRSLLADNGCVCGYSGGVCGSIASSSATVEY